MIGPLILCSMFGPVPPTSVLLVALLRTHAVGPQGEDAVQPHATTGYTLFSPLHSRRTYLLDSRGDVAFTWELRLPGAGAVELGDDGLLLRSTQVAAQGALLVAGGQGGRIEELDAHGRVVWELDLSTDRYFQHHDLERTPRGTVLLLAWERKSADEAQAAGRSFGPDRPEALWSEVVLEIEPLPPNGGRVVWEWHLWDHLVQELHPGRPNFGVVREHPERLDINAGREAPPAVSSAESADLRALGYGGSEADSASGTVARGGDWVHANALDYDPESERILLCSRGLSELWVIDHSTTSAEAATHAGGRSGRGGDFLARWGNPRNHGAGGESEQRLFHPHAAHWIPYGLPGHGNVLLFNNGPRPGKEQSSEVLELRLSAAGSAVGSGEPVWSCDTIGGTPFYSSLLSAAQRLPNGNTLVTIGVEGRLAEITCDGTLVWEYRHALRPDELHRPLRDATTATPPERALRASIFRATRIPLDHPGLAGLQLLPGHAEEPAASPSGQDETGG
jgi:hypothetical protein